MRARMKRRNVAAKADVSMQSMIDVVFLLLIFFIVTQKPIVEDTLMPVDMPSGHGGATGRSLLTIDVHRHFNDPAKDIEYYRVNGGAVRHIDWLADYLRSTAANDPDQTIIVNCDPNAEHRKLIQLLDTINLAGLGNINLVNDEGRKFVPNHSR